MGTVTALRRSVADGLTNLMSRLGSGADRNTHNRYYAPMLTQADAEAAHRSSWLTRKVHDLVPFEMTRAGRSWQAEKDQIEKLEGVEGALQLWSKLRQVLMTARLHGGAALVLGVRQGMPDQPLVVDRLGANSLRYVFVASRYQLYAPEGFDPDPESDFFGTPAMWEMRGAKGNRVRIHPSRVITFHGSPLPPAALMLSQLDTFWGDPLLISIKAAIDNAEVSQAAVATLLHEMKQDVISIPGLTERIATVGAEELLAARIAAVDRFKSMFNALLLDGGDQDGNGKEEWETRQVSFTQMPEMVRQFIAIVAGAADIPVTRLMGESPGGLQSTGKGEQDDFHDMIASQQSANLRPQLVRFDEILMRSALGTRPAEIGFVFTPLKKPDPLQAATIEKTEAETVQIYTATGHIPTDAMAQAVANRMIESGRWPGLDQGIEDSKQELGEANDPANQPDPPVALPLAANENDVQAMAKRGTINGDQALTLLTDASPRSLYVHRKLLNGDEVAAWAKAQKFTTTTPPGEMHVTIAYSRQPVDWMKAGADGWGNDDKGNLTIAPGGPRIVEKLGDAGAVVLFFASPSLSWRHEDIKREAGAAFDFDNYQPHVTITYQMPAGMNLRDVVPFAGQLRFGPEVFEEVTEGWAATVTEV